MVITERLNGTDWTRTYSDLGKSLLQVETGLVYEEAIDHISHNYTYIETEGDQQEIEDEEAYRIIADEEPRDSDEEPGEDEISDIEALNIMLGRDEEE